MKDHSGGAHGERTRLKNQMRRLFRCGISLLYTDGARGRKRKLVRGRSDRVLVGYQTAGRAPCCGTARSGSGKNSSTRSSRTPVPIDMHILKAVKRSPLGLDLYLWLTYRTFALKTPLTLSWRQLYRQFGVDAANAGNKSTVNRFRSDCLRELKEKLSGRGLGCTIRRSGGHWCCYRRRRASSRHNCASSNDGADLTPRMVDQRYIGGVGNRGACAGTPLRIPAGRGRRSWLGARGPVDGSGDRRHAGQHGRDHLSCVRPCARLDAPATGSRLPRDGRTRATHRGPESLRTHDASTATPSAAPA